VSIVGQGPFMAGRGTLESPARVFPFGVSRNRLEQAIQATSVPAIVVRDLREADAVVTLKNYYRRRPQPLREAESRGVPIYVLRSNTVVQMSNLLRSLFSEVIGNARLSADEELRAGFDEIPEDQITAAMFEAESGIHQVLNGVGTVSLRPQAARVRRLQHELAERYNVGSRSRGREPHRYVEILRQSSY
jgi:hypothetical protein